MLHELVKIDVKVNKHVVKFDRRFMTFVEKYHYDTFRDLKPFQSMVG